MSNVWFNIYISIKHNNNIESLSSVTDPFVEDIEGRRGWRTEVAGAGGRRGGSGGRS